MIYINIFNKIRRRVDVKKSKTDWNNSSSKNRKSGSLNEEKAL